MDKKFMMRHRRGIDYNDTVKCYCKNCRCNNSVEIPCANDFLVCDICLLGKCNPRSNKPRIDYIKIAYKDKNNLSNLEEAMQTL